MITIQRPLNPFDPSNPISPGRFVGRAREIGELVAALQHAKHGRPRHFLITGDRGAGKTSFLDYSRKAATSRSQGFNFLVVDFAVDKHSTRLDLVRVIQQELSGILGAHAPLRDLAGRAWSFIQRFEVAGVAYRANEPLPENHRDICRNLADSLREVVNSICVDIENGDQRLGYDGILLLIDELDQASDELDIGTFLKLLLERLNSVGCRQVLVGMAGLHESTDVLVRSHKSSLRIFDELALESLEKDDVAELFAIAELAVRNEGYPDFSFEKSARDAILRFSGGHAHFVQQFGYCAFEKAFHSDLDVMSVRDSHVIDGAFERRGAVELIGDMYFTSAYSEIESDEIALLILDYLCEVPNQLLTAVKLGSELQISPERVEVALSNLQELGLLSSSRGESAYKIRHACFAFWFKSKRPSS